MTKSATRLKRRIVVVVIAVLAGLFVSVACAWASARWAELNTYSSDMRLPDSEAMWLEYLQPHFPPAVQATKRIWLDGSSSIGVDVKIIYSEKSHPVFTMGRQVEEYPGGTFIETIHEFGWPLRCLSYEYPACIAPSTPATLAVVGKAGRDVGFRRGIEMPFSPGNWRRLPVTPIPFGLATNTLIFGGLTWLLLVGPRSIREWHRHRNGRCRGCGYPIGVSPVCTECGEPVVPTTSVQGSSQKLPES